MLLKEAVKQPRRQLLLSADHFTVDGTLLDAWASHKSYRPRDERPPDNGRRGGRNRPRDRRSNRGQAFKSDRRSRATHASTTDLEARHYHKGKQPGAQLCYLGHVLSENRNGLVGDVELTQADPGSSQGQAGTPNGTPPCQCSNAAACPALDARSGGRSTLGAVRAYDTRNFVCDLRALGVTPHIAQNEQGRRSAIDRRTTRHPGYARSQR